MASGKFNLNLFLYLDKVYMWATIDQQRGSIL